MTYEPSHVANYMLERAESEGRHLTPMKLLKLVYIAYGWSIALLRKKLFDEQFRAWDHGPVVRSLYHEFKHFGGSAIRGRAVTLDLESQTVCVPTIPEEDEETNIVLDKVWDIYKDFGAWALRDKTHEPGTPWNVVYEDEERRTAIPDPQIGITAGGVRGGRDVKVSGGDGEYK